LSRVPGNTWRKSSYSSESANCVEFAHSADHVAVRDSKDPEGGMLLFNVESWQRFLGSIRQGEFDHPA